MGIRWEDPPAKIRGIGAAIDAGELELVRELKANPGRTARAFEFKLDADGKNTRAPSVAQQIKAGTRGAFREGGFKAVSRKLADEGLGVVYVTYVGEQSNTD